MRWLRRYSRWNSWLRFNQVGGLILGTQICACQVIDGTSDALADGIQSLIELQQSGTGSFVPTTDDGMGLICWAENSILVPGEPPMYVQRLRLLPTSRGFNGRRIEVSGYGHTDSALAAVTIDIAMLERLWRHGVTSDGLNMSDTIVYGTLSAVAANGDVCLEAEINMNAASSRALCLIVPFATIPPNGGIDTVCWRRVELKTRESDLGGNR
jgi:hypothetical protein